MKKFLLAVSLVSLTACKKQEPAPPSLPVKSVASGLELIDYQEPSGAFESLGPAAWQVREDDAFGPTVMYLGPGTKAYPRSVDISISRYPNKADASPDPLKYYKGLELVDSVKIVSPFAKRTIGGREVEHYAVEAPRRPLHQRKVAYHTREDVAIIRFPGGFYRIDHTAPVAIHQETLPVFEAVVASFKPGPLAAAKAP